MYLAEHHYAGSWKNDHCGEIVAGSPIELDHFNEAFQTGLVRGSKLRFGETVVHDSVSRAALWGTVYSGISKVVRVMKYA